MLLLSPKSTLFPYTTLFRSYENVGRRNVEECILSHWLTTPSARFRSLAVTHLSQLRALHTIIILIHQIRFSSHSTKPCALQRADRKSTRLNSSHANISYAVF